MKAIFLIVAGIALADPSGDAEIRAKAGDSEIVIRTTSRLAGAIDSLTWNGKEFIDNFDHGRQLQSASNFDAGSEFTPETPPKLAPERTAGGRRAVVNCCR